MNVLWTKGHPTNAQSRNMLLSDVELYLNRAADRFADEAAARVQVSDEDVRRTHQADKFAADILYRLLAVKREVVFNTERERVPRPRRERGQSTSFAERMCRLRDAGHQPVKRKAVIHCPACARGFSLKGSLADFWPDPCKPRCVIQQRLQLLPHRPVRDRYGPDPAPDDLGPSGLCGPHGWLLRSLTPSLGVPWSAVLRHLWWLLHCEAASGLEEVLSQAH